MELHRGEQDLGHAEDSEGQVVEDGNEDVVGGASGVHDCELVLGADENGEVDHDAGDEEGGHQGGHERTNEALPSLLGRDLNEGSAAQRHAPDIGP